MIIPSPPRCGRRRFCWSLASASAALLALRSHSAAGEAACARSDIKASDAAIAADVGRLHYWVDGLQPERRNIAFLIKSQQTPERYISKAVLTTGDKATIGIRYFNADDKLSNGYLPYIIFNDVDLFFSKLYFLILQIEEGGASKVLRYPLLRSELERSSLQGRHLPAELEHDFKSSHNGRVWTAFHLPMAMLRGSACQDYPHKPRVCWEAHSVKPYVIAIDPAKNDFTLSIDCPHPDLTADHYRRYYIVTDPVGRLLGLVKRAFAGANAARERIQVKALTKDERVQRWGLASEHTAVIGDCPYIKVFADDAKEGLFSRDIWLR